MIKLEIVIEEEDDGVSYTINKKLVEGFVTKKESALFDSLYSVLSGIFATTKGMEKIKK